MGYIQLSSIEDFIELEAYFFSFREGDNLLEENLMMKLF